MALTVMVPSPFTRPSLGRASTEAQLLDYATRAAVIDPGKVPTANDWIFVKSEYADSSKGSGGFLFGPPDERKIDLSWYKADGTAIAGGIDVPASFPATQKVSTKISISPSGMSTGGACPFASDSYSYLSSLPTDPAALDSAILALNKPQGDPCYDPSPDVAVFTAISNLLKQQEITGATDGTDHFKKGQILGWDALLVSAIVTGPGQLP